MKFGFYICFMIAASILLQASTRAEPASPELQTVIIRLYSEDRCDAVRALEPTIHPNDLRPNVLAVYASCEPTHQDPEKLFQLAEQKNPTGDLILVLHGKYRFKKNPESSLEIWQRLKFIARSIYFRDLATDYLSDNVDTEKNAKPLNLSDDTRFTRIFFGAYQKDHDNPAYLSFLNGKPVYGLFAQGDFRVRHWFPWGWMGYFGNSSIEHSLISSDFNHWDTGVELPVAIHIGVTKDLIFKPFASYAALAGNPFSLNYGFGIKAAVYKDDYLQSVEAIIYGKRIFNSLLQAEQGAHYRFEYTWDFYEPQWNISTQFAVEHVSATPTDQYLGKKGTFEMSHNDLGVNFKFHRELKQFTVGLDPALSYRLDTQPSSYTSGPSGNTVTEEREDWELHLNANVSIPVWVSTQLYAWYEWTKVLSNVGSGDYVNRNFTNQTVGVGLKTAFSSY